jgi:cell division protein ZapA
MGQVSIQVNDHPYVVGCEDGQEARLAELAAMVDQHVRQVAHDVGVLGETRLILMGALVMADELSELHGRLQALQTELADVKAAQGRTQLAAVAALEAAAAKIETLAAG